MNQLKRLSFADANQSMTSLEIAKITGKQHSHVLRDIRELLKQGVSESNFGLSSHKQAQPQGGYKEVSMYLLTPKGVLILASGYNALLREKIINRLEELEIGKVKQKQLSVPVSEQLSTNLSFADWSAKFLNLNEASKLGWARTIGEKFGLVTDALPRAVNVGTANPTTHSATDLLKRHNVGLSARVFNKVLELRGVVKAASRHGRYGKMHTWFVLLPQYDRFGENQQNPQYQQQTQIRWYDATFDELLVIVGLSRQQTLQL